MHILQVLVAALISQNLSAMVVSFEPGTSPEARLAKFEELLDSINGNYRPPHCRSNEDVEIEILELGSDPEVRAAFTNFKLFLASLSWFITYLVFRPDSLYDKAIQIMLQCPNLDISGISAHDLRMADDWLPRDTKEVLWNKLAPTDRLYREMTHYNEHQPIKCSVYVKLLRRGFNNAATIDWLNLLNYEADKYFLPIEDKKNLLRSMAPLLISNLAQFSENIRIAENQGFSAAERFMLPTYKACLLLLAAQTFFEQFGLPMEILIILTRKVFELEAPFEKPLTMQEHAALLVKQKLKN